MFPGRLRRSTETRWLHRVCRGVGASTRLLCLPYAGGTAQVFWEWARYLPSSVELLVVQPPGRAERMDEPPVDELDGFCDAVMTGLDMIGGDATPLAVFGHSMGALIGFELARRLQARGRAPLALFASAYRAPHLPARRPPLHSLSTDQLMVAIAALGGVPNGVLAEPEWVAMIEPALRADLRLIERCLVDPDPRLTCPIHVFGGDVDALVGVDELRAWSEHTHATTSLTLFRGDHFFLRLQGPSVCRAIALALQAALRKDVASTLPEREYEEGQHA